MKRSIGNVHSVINPYCFMTECFRLPLQGNLTSRVRMTNPVNCKEVLWIDGFANKLLVNGIGSAYVEAGGLFYIGRDACHAEGSEGCNLSSYHFKGRWKSWCVCALNVKVPKVRF